MDKLIEEIKRKKELNGISDNIVLEQVKKYLSQNKKINLENKRSSDYKQLIKEVRAKLRRSYGLFRVENIKINEGDDSESILAAHSSTKERSYFYPELYKKIFTITGKPKIILDLGCGVNPLSYSFMNLKKVEYHAYDINEKEIALINNYFRREKILGEAAVLDVSKGEEVKKLPSADLAFLFKITDILDRGKGHKKTEEVLVAIPVKWVVISFPTLTMSGKPMNAPRRRWMEWLCGRLGYPYTVLEFSNEIFYVIKKKD
ncbi:MAG: hypothetical protein WCV90_00375 [Candidatus Woesearchaeota archaeon]|jgi:hypothetical protein